MDPEVKAVIGLVIWRTALLELVVVCIMLAFGP